MDYSKKKELVKKFSDRLLSHAEFDEFYEMVKQGEFDAEYDQILTELEEERKELFLIPVESKNRIEERLDAIIYQEKKKRALKWLWQAASVAAILVSIFAGHTMWEEHQFIKLTQTYTTVTVPQDHMTRVELPDGTKVTLSPGATFRYPKKFEKDARQVYLDEGRGFFDVAKDKTKPFTVHSAKLATTALGTSFIVQNYKEYGYEKVSLYTGKVQIDLSDDNSAEPVILVPGQEFEKDKGQNHHNVHQFDLSGDPMTDGRLVFNKERMNVVLYNIASRYHVKLNFNPEIMKDLFVTGAYEQTNAKDILNSIAFTHNLKIKSLTSQTYSIMKK